MERVVVICGAGVSESCGFPSTTALTQEAVVGGTFIRSALQYRSRPVNSNEWETDEEVLPVTRLLWSALRGHYTDPTFETYIHALETLIPIAISRRDAGYHRDDYRPITMAYAETLTRYDGLLRFGILQRERVETIKRLFEHLCDASRKIKETSSKAVMLKAAIRSLFAAVNERSEVRIINLNYDDLLDELLGTEGDGFVASMEGTTALAFDANGFKDVGIPSGGSIHLHGSVRFGYGLSVHGEPAPILKYADTEAALKSLDRAIINRDIFRGDRINAGLLRASVPMISGFQKADKVMLTPVPFGYYYHAAVAELMRTKRIVVLGYSGSDPHINAWLYESARLHGESFRMAYVTKQKNFSPVIATREMEFIQGITGYGASSRTEGYVSYIGAQVAGTGAGLPLDDDTQGKLLDFVLS